MIYEERFTTVSPEGGREYLNLCRQQTIPALRAAGGEILCLVTGQIGDPGNTFLTMTGFPSLEAWQAAQECYGAERTEMVDSEQVRLLRRVASLPKGPPSPEDRRASYGYRRFFIDPADLAQFVRCSEEGVWPLHHASGSRILGLWTPLESTYPMEIVLMTGYDGPKHWEATRFYDGKPAGLDDGLWERGRTLGRERNGLVIRNSWVRLFRAHDVDEAG